MKVKALLFLLLSLPVQFVSACPVCDNQQPKIIRGLVHGAGPQSDLDLVIIAIITAITLITFVLSLKYLIHPGEKNADHIKQLVLNNK